MDPIPYTHPTLPGTTQPAAISSMPTGLPPGLPMTLGDADASQSTPTTPTAMGPTIPSITPIPMGPQPTLLQESTTAAPSGWYAPPDFGKNVLGLSTVEVYVIIFAIAMMIISASLVVSFSGK